MSDISLISASAIQTPTFSLDTTEVASASTPNVQPGQNVDAVSQDFEAVFLTQMMSAMFEGDSLSSYFGSGSQGEIYKSFLLNEYGKLIAKSGGIGIAQSIKQELLKLQEYKQ